MVVIVNDNSKPDANDGTLVLYCCASTLCSVVAGNSRDIDYTFISSPFRRKEGAY